ncbi:MAG: endonuclease/exonuclease/phosphatase family protein [Aureispira sp.]
MRVMTYNILNDHPKFAALPKKNWTDRKMYLLQHIQTLQPDVLAIQEGAPHQVEELLQGLSSFAYYGPQAGGGYGGEQVGIFYNEERFALLNKDTFWLSPTPEVVSKDWGATHHRICTWVQLQERETKATFFHFNTHLEAKNKRVRAKQLQVILQKITTLKTEEPTAAIILTGDFNAAVSSVVYQKAVNNAYLKDAFWETKKRKNTLDYSFSGVDKAWTLDKLLLHLFYPNYMHKRLDHIFVTKEIEVATYEISNWSYGNFYPSDHWPILIEIGRLC